MIKRLKEKKPIYDLELSDPMTSLIKAKYSNTLNWLEINLTTCICAAKRFEILRECLQHAVPTTAPLPCLPVDTCTYLCLPDNRSEARPPCTYISHLCDARSPRGHKV